MNHIALLRGINVGGNKLIAMSELRARLEQLGFSNPRTLLQSGNVVFGSSRRTPPQLERLLETDIQRHFEMSVDVFVRTAEEWNEVIARNPFRAEAKRDPARLVVMFLRDTPAAKHLAALQAAVVGAETARAAGRHLYVFYPDGMGRSRLTNVALEKILMTRGSARNWNTVLKLAAAAVI